MASAATVTDTLWRLVWALPLVLLVGFFAVLVLKRFVMPTQSATASIPRVRLRDSLSLSDDTRVHLIEVDREAFVIIESTRQTVLQSAIPSTTNKSRPLHRPGPPWLQRLYKARSR